MVRCDGVVLPVVQFDRDVEGGISVSAYQILDKKQRGRRERKEQIASRETTKDVQAIRNEVAPARGGGGDKEIHILLHIL